MVKVRRKARRKQVAGVDILFFFDDDDDGDDEESEKLVPSHLNLIQSHNLLLSFEVLIVDEEDEAEAEAEESSSISLSLYSDSVCMKKTAQGGGEGGGATIK